jgi:dihydrolipoamide dehydrogenase
MTDLIVIGAGPGGYELALEASRNGLSTILIEGKKLGGTCLQEGCIPTKTYYKNAIVFNTLKEASIYGINIPSYDFDFSKVVERKEKVVQDLEKGILFLLNKAGVEIIKGFAKFLSPTEVEVNGTVYQAKNMVIATGSEPISLANFPDALTSTHLLNLTEIPEKLVVIGGGVIGIEMASIFASFGSNVSVVEATNSIIGFADSDISKRLLAFLKAKGIKFYLNAKALKHENSQVTIATEKGEIVLDATHVLMAVGRRPNLNNLELENAHVEYTKKGIVTNEFGQTSNPNIYAIGDVTGINMLAHYATYDGLRVLNHILGKPNNIRFDLVPACVFTFPEVAWCGKTEQELASEGINYQTHKGMFRANGKALAMNETDGFVKIITVDNLIAGVHIIGSSASTLVHELCSLMNFDITKDRFLSIIHAHPTLSEIFTSTLKQ